MDIKEVIKASEYDFLRTNKYLKDNLMFLCLGGSHAYGTNHIESDIDVRGCAFPKKRDILLGTDFEQVVDSETDTTIYSFTKFVSLLVNCNPNTVEFLGVNPEHMLVTHEIGKSLIKNRHIFLSQRAATSFGGYATQQLRRLQNAVARDALSQVEKERHILMSIKSMLMSFNLRYKDFPEGGIELFIDKSDKEDLDEEIYMNVNLSKYPLRDYKGLWSEMNEIVKVYGKLNHRNKKKTEKGLNKHAMHLVRLYLMVLDILERGEIITNREKDLVLLTSILNGKYMNEDGTYRPEFFELISDYERKVMYAKKYTSLPPEPNMDRIEEFLMSVNEIVVQDNWIFRDGWLYVV